MLRRYECCSTRPQTEADKRSMEWMLKHNVELMPAVDRPFVIQTHPDAPKDIPVVQEPSAD